MNANKQIISIGFIFFFLIMFAKAQTSLNIYPLNGTVGVRFFSDKKISLEPRVDFQFDFSGGESNAFINTELFTVYNFRQDENLNLYTGIGLGANIYNQAQSNFSGSLPFGATYYFTDSKRFAVTGECGLKITAYDYLKIKSYGLIGLQFRFKKS